MKPTCRRSSIKWSRRKPQLTPELIQSLFAAYTPAEIDENAANSTQPLFPLRFAASDDLNVKGFATRYGVTPSMLHRAPDYDHKFLAWIRKSGGTFVGKLHCHSPFSVEDCCAVRDHRAASAVEHGACDVVVSSSGIGPAAITAAAAGDVFAFKPSTSSLPQPIDGRRRSVGLVFSDFASCECFWKVMTAVGSDADCDGEQPREVPASGGKAESVTVGVPVQWLNEMFQSPVGDALMQMLRERSGGRYSVEQVSLQWSPHEEISRALMLGRAALHAKLEKHGLAGTGIVEQLDPLTMAHVVEGSKISEDDVASAMDTINKMRTEFTEEMASVDCVCVPLLCPPYDRTLQSVSSLLPFSLINCPIMGTRLPVEPDSAGRPSASSMRTFIKKIAKGEGEPLGFAEPHYWRNFVGEDAAETDRQQNGEDNRLRTVGGSLPIAIIGEPGQDTVLFDVVRALMTK